MEPFSIKSSVFKEGGMIPQKYTSDGEGINPFLEFKNIPHEARSLALIMDDPDGTRGLFTHWLLWNIDPSTRYIMDDTVPQGAVQGTNSANTQRYFAPAPPHGAPAHRYQFTVFVLDVVLNLSPDTKRETLEEAFRGHILAQATLTGMYGRA